MIPGAFVVCECKVLANRRSAIFPGTIMIKCHNCLSRRVSIRGEVWVDFYEDGRREIDEQDLEEFEPKFGDLSLCRICGFTWTYGEPD
jgi:hypothetical protein